MPARPLITSNSSAIPLNRVAFSLNQSIMIGSDSSSFVILVLLISSLSDRSSVLVQLGGNQHQLIGRRTEHIGPPPYHLRSAIWECNGHVFILDQC